MDLYLMADRSFAGIAKATPSSNDARAAALRWFDELRIPLRRYLLCDGVGSADADEAVQETFLRLYQHLEKNGDQSNVRAWVFQVARNYVRDSRKSARQQRTVPLDDAMDREGHFPDPADSPEHRALRRERTRRLQEAMGRLPRPQRECILLRSSGLRYREIAEVLGIHTNSVGALIERAVARLNEELS